MDTLLQKTQQAAQSIIDNPLCDAFYKKCLKRKIAALSNGTPTASIQRALGEILLIAENIKNGIYIE